VQITTLQPGQARLKGRAEKLHAATQRLTELMDWLISQGFHPTSFHVELERRPIIQIAISGKCQVLKSKHKAYMHERTNLFTTWRCEMNGCRVQWVETGH
jgi:hypothetical protein